jgi:DUF4097 and DUF4098 domain-containing protein YvlB
MNKQLLVILPLVLLASAPLISEAKTESLHVERSFPVSPGDRVVVDVSFHETQVRVRPGSTVDITVDLEISASAAKARRLIKQYTPVIAKSGREVSVRSSARGVGWSLGRIRKSGKITVLMPPDVSLVVDSSSGSTRIDGDLGNGSAHIDASSGGVRISGGMDELEVDVSSGSVDVQIERPVRKAAVSTSSGSVSLDGPVHDLEVGTSSGSIRADGLLGPAELGASSGSITASWQAIPSGSRVSVSTSSGRVRLTFPTGTELSGEVDTSSGGVTSDFPGRRSSRGHHLALEGGAEAVRLQVDTSSGSVRLSSR